MVIDALGWKLLATGMAMVFVAGLIRGFTGFGFSIAAVPLLSLIMPPAEAVPIVMLLQLGVSSSGMGEAVQICDWRSIRWLAAGAVIASPIGIWGLAHLPAAPVRLVMAGIVALAVVILARGMRLRVTPSPGHVMGFGLVSGLFNGLVGMPGPPVIAFYLASPIGVHAGRASMIVFFLATSLFGLLPLAFLGMLSWTLVIASVIAFPAVWLGSRIGARLYRSAPERGYRIVALSLLVATAVLAAGRAVMAFTP